MEVTAKPAPQLTLQCINLPGLYALTGTQEVDAVDAICLPPDFHIHLTASIAQPARPHMCNLHTNQPKPSSKTPIDSQKNS
ncbi:MAG: hypothetical protein KatS3mg050_3043 [Litorilinea sp.]|nr:MAG: hypothetical protein KatS3mg050_3043 [Litorilinea sp.]